MQYEAALEALEALIDFEKLGATYFGRDRFQLANVRRLLAACGDPQRSLRVAHIAGTKGKGSTAAILAAVVRQHGLRTGLFTQPHLRDIRERTRVDGEAIPPTSFATLVEAVLPQIQAINGDPQPNPITFYEAHLALSLAHFAAEGVDVAVMETGLGGRLDATNALSPEVTAITRIDYDHTDLLGETLEEIAAEKAGIIKPGVPCVLAPQDESVTRVLRERCEQVGAPVVPFPAINCEPGGGFALRTREAAYAELRLPLRGRHQQENAGVAVAMAEVLVDLRPERVRAAVSALQWPGRFQVVAGRPVVVLDVAHNAISARVLREGLEELLVSTGGRLICVAGLARDKDIASFAKALFPIAHHVVATRAESARAADVEAIAGPAAKFADTSTAPDVRAAIAAAQALARPEDVVCVTGSFHVVGEAMAVLDIQP